MNVNGNNAVAQTQGKGKGNPAPTLKQWVLMTTDQIKNALPANITPERMSRIALTALSKNADLAQSTPESFLGALLTSAQLGLECNTPLGQAYLIPYRNKGVMETQFQVGYQGLIDLWKGLWHMQRNIQKLFKRVGHLRGLQILKVWQKKLF